MGIFVRCQAFYFLRRSTTSVLNTLMRRQSMAGGEQSLLFIKTTPAICFLARLQSEEVAVASLQLPQQGGQPLPPQPEWQTAPPHTHKMADGPPAPHRKKAGSPLPRQNGGQAPPVPHTHKKKWRTGALPRQNGGQGPRPTLKKAGSS